MTANWIIAVTDTTSTKHQASVSLASMAMAVTRFTQVLLYAASSHLSSSHLNRQHGIQFPRTIFRSCCCHPSQDGLSHLVTFMQQRPPGATARQGKQRCSHWSHSLQLYALLWHSLAHSMSGCQQGGDNPDGSRFAILAGDGLVARPHTCYLEWFSAADRQSLCQKWKALQKSP